jgi:hypothetical protein
MAAELGVAAGTEGGGTYAGVDPFEHEQRYLLTRAQAVSFFAGVGPRATVELYDRFRPISYTRTTYLDTDDLTYFRSCEGPVARRLRVREYAVASTLEETPMLSGICFLELKQNQGTARSKIRLSAPSAVLVALIEGSGNFDSEAAGLEQLTALRAIQDELTAAPVTARLTTWYRRSCATGEGGRVRITLDEGLAFCKPQPLGAPGEKVAPLGVAAYGPSRILEVKHWGDKPEWLSRATEGLTPTPGFSKFRMGMMALQQQGEAPEIMVARSTTPTLFLLGDEL